MSKKAPVNEPKTKGGGLWGALGIKTEKVKTEDDEKAENRQKQVKLAWQWVRGRIDQGVHDYYTTGTFDKLEEYVERPALDALKAHLHELRRENILWRQPDRRTTTAPTVTVQDIKLNKRQTPVQFTIRERFEDHSTYERVTQSGELQLDARCPGKERVIEAVVTVTDGQAYKLHSVRQVTSAMLG